MAEAVYNCKVKKMPKDMKMTIKIHYTKEFRLRMFISRCLFKLGALILGFSVNIDEEKIDEA